MQGKNISDFKHIHFVGIGGIGMSAIARMFLLENKEVSGSDLSHSQVTQELEEVGAKIFYSQDSSHVPVGADLVVYTIAVSADNPEIVDARNRGILTLSYPEILGLISKDKFTIAVAGTHGKTTTTAMIAKILIDAGLDPTVIVGSFLKDQKSNFVAGKGKYFVVEACEYRRSFLNINPSLVVITNVDNDHLDYYKDMTDIQSAFREFAGRLSREEWLVCDLAGGNMTEVVLGLDCKVEDYEEGAAAREARGRLLLPGTHNKKNALAALAVSKILGIKIEDALKSLNAFSGTWRRFEKKGKTRNGALVYDDYAHHPTEIKATISLAKELYPDKKINIVFQPHLFSRTKDHANDFGPAFEKANQIFLVPIYAAREPFDSSISSDILAQKIKDYGQTVSSHKDFQEVEKELSNKNENDIIIIMGAGDIGALADRLV